MNREDLKKYKYNQKWIEGRFEYIEQYKATLTNITSTLSDMPHGSKQVQDSMAEKLTTIMDNINDLVERVVIESNKQKSILKQLDKVEQPYKLILEKAYIQGKTLVTVASEMGYDYKHMCKMNGVALKKFDEHDKKGVITT